MSILFYDHLIDKSEILIFIESLPEPENRKSKLRQLTDDIIHQGIIEYILQKLHPHQHHNFLSRLHTTPFDPELISFLKEHIGENVESQLETHGRKLLRTLKHDLGISG